MIYNCQFITFTTAFYTTLKTGNNPNVHEQQKQWMFHGHSGILYSNPHTTTVGHNTRGQSLQSKIKSESEKIIYDMIYLAKF